MEPLEGIRIIDAAVLFAGPTATTLLGDFGADVIKVEHPKGDPVRAHGYHKGGVSLWWKVISRNKRAITLNLAAHEGQKMMAGIVQNSDVMVESFRPGTLERWNLGPEALHRLNPRLIVTRVSGFGQSGPYSGRPGFGTLAEAMSGFAAMTGEPDSPPTLPPFALADMIAGFATAMAILIALHVREKTGRGQVIDTALIEPILATLGPQATFYDQLGIVEQRRGNRSAHNSPRNTYRTSDGQWVAISTSTQSVAERVMLLVGHPEVIRESWFGSAKGRVDHDSDLDRIVASWIARHTLDDVVSTFNQAQAAVAPIYDIRQIVEDPQYKARGTFTTIEDPDLGPLKMQDVIVRLSETPGRIRWAGRKKGEDNEDVYRELLGLDGSRLKELAAQGII